MLLYHPDFRLDGNARQMSARTSTADTFLVIISFAHAILYHIIAPFFYIFVIFFGTNVKYQKTGRIFDMKICPV